MLSRAGELTQPQVASGDGHVSDDAQISSTRCLRGLQRLLAPCQGLRNTPLREDVACQFPEDWHERIVAPERPSQGQGWMQAGPDFRRSPGFKRRPRSTKQAA